MPYYLITWKIRKRNAFKSLKLLFSAPLPLNLYNKKFIRPHIKSLSHNAINKKNLNPFPWTANAMFTYCSLYPIFNRQIWPLARSHQPGQLPLSPQLISRGKYLNMGAPSVV